MSTAVDFLSRSEEPVPHRPVLAWAVLLLIVALGAGLRLYQFTEQVLLDDEWHAIHQILQHSPAEMFKTFGHADYSIPLGLWYAWLANHGGLSEALMRLPMMVVGILLLLCFPGYVVRRLGWPVALLFAFFLAISPLLVTYSRMARPYGLTVFLVWAAHAAFLRYWKASTRRQAMWSGIAYTGCGALAIWLHLITAPFVAAPFAWGLWQRFKAQSPSLRRVFLWRGAALATGFILVTTALVGLPLANNFMALSVKSGVDVPSLETFEGALYLWFGSNQPWTAVLCGGLALLGIRYAWQLAIVRTGLLGIGITFFTVLLMRPAWVFNPVTFVRYVLPLLPLLLLFLAAGCWVVGRWFQKVSIPPGFSKTVATVFLTAVAWASPLHEQLRMPNSNSLGIFFAYDYRPWENEVFPWMFRLLPSPFWQQQAKQLQASEKIAVAPFSFESYDWNGALWELMSRQRVTPAFLNGFCTQGRAGELPGADDHRFRFRNAVFLSDVQSLKDHRVDWIVWQKENSRPPLAWDATNMTECEAKWRTTFGQPDYEDAFLLAYRVKNL